MTSSSYYSDFIKAMQANAAQVLAQNDNKMFMVKMDKNVLWEAYLAAISDPDRRQHYNCAACRSFVNRYGRLAVITSGGKVKSLLWGDWATGELAQAIKAMQVLVEQATISSIYYTSQRLLGVVSTICDRHGYNDHMHLVVPEAARYTGNQRDWELANWAQRDFANFIKAADEFSIENIDTAYAVLTGPGVNRAELAIPQAEWVRETMYIVRNFKNKGGFANMLWKRIAAAPIGWASWKNSLFGTAIKDAKAGMSIGAIRGRFNDKTSSTSYMRSTREVTQTDKELAIDKLRSLGLIESLQRRYGVKADYVKNALWLDRNAFRVEKPMQDDPFAHIAVAPARKPVAETVDDTKVATMTWARFKRDVLNNASSIEVQVPTNPNHFVSLVGPVNNEAPNILKWDNAIGWFYDSGADAVFDERLKRENAAHGSGLEVANTLIWSGYSDLDLELRVRGFRVYFGVKKVGDYDLDVDMNALGRKSAEPVENIISPRALRGHRHTVRVTMFDHRTENPSKPIEFTVRVCVMGQTKFFTGTFPAYAGDYSYFEVVHYTITDDGRVIWETGEWVQERTGQGCGPMTWGLVPGSFVKCEGIVPSPNAWANEDQPNTHTFFMLEGCKHDPQTGNGYAFLNEFLRGDLHPHRAMMEKYCKSLPLAGAENASAAGLGYSPNFDWNVLLRVKQKIGTVESIRLIKIDRME